MHEPADTWEWPYTTDPRDGARPVRLLAVPRMR